MPAWIPARPLLLGYLASKRLLLETLELDSADSPAAAWDSLLDKISNREAQIEAGINGESVRRILERLASISRKHPDGIGPISSEDLGNAYKDVCLTEPDDLGILLLQRLPGLGALNSEDGTRQLIDSSLADAARAGDIVRFIRDPFNTQLGDTQSWQCLLSDIGLAVAVIRLTKMSLKVSQLIVAIGRASEQSQQIVAGDIIRIIHQSPFQLPPDEAITIREVYFPFFEINPEGSNNGTVTFLDCLFGRLDIPSEVTPEQIPTFRQCSIDSIESRVGRMDIPESKFPSTEIAGFSQSAATTAEIMNLSLPVQVNVMLTILKKIYLQKGSGRRQSALYRGLDSKAKGFVPGIIDLLEKNNLLVKMGLHGEFRCFPVRGQATRVRSLLAAPTNSTDNLINLAKAI